MIYNIFLLAGIVFNVAAQILLKTAGKGLDVMQSSQSAVQKMFEMISNSYFWGAIICYGMGFLFYSIVLSKMEVSRAYPISSVGAIILIYLSAIVLFNESADSLKTMGIVFCMLGILMIYR